MRRIDLTIRLVIVFVAGLNAVPSGGQQQATPPATGQDIDVVRVETTLVVLSVRVKDRHGRFVVNAGSVFEH